MPTYRNKRVLPYTCEQIYDLVIDVEAYPLFLPWCQAVRIKERGQGFFTAEVRVDVVVLSGRFVSRVHEDPDKRKVCVEYEKGDLKKLVTRWILTPCEGGCEVSFFIDFSFRTPFFQRSVHTILEDVSRRIVTSFEKRALEMYG